MAGGVRSFLGKMSGAGTRRGMLAKIHVAIKQTGMTDDEYRFTLQDRFGVDSSAELTNGQLHTLLDIFRARGFQDAPGTKAKVKPKAELASDGQSKMIRALWLELRDAGVLRDPSEQGLAMFIKRQTGVERLEWLSTAKASQVIEALKAWVDRAA